MPRYEQENAKMIRVTLANEVAFARVGAMVAFSGEVSFQRAFLAGGGVQALAMRQGTIIVQSSEQGLAGRSNLAAILARLPGLDRTEVEQLLLQTQSMLGRR